MTNAMCKHRFVRIANSVCPECAKESGDKLRAAFEPAPGEPKYAAEIETLLRKWMARYDWSKRETQAINDYILTARFGIAEDFEKLLAASLGASGETPEPPRAIEYQVTRGIVAGTSEYAAESEESRATLCGIEIDDHWMRTVGLFTASEFADRHDACPSCLRAVIKRSATRDTGAET